MSLMSFLRALLGNSPLFTLQTPSGEELRVVRFFGREGLSSLFEFNLELAGGEVDLAAMVDTPAVLKIDGIDAPRYVSGIFAAFEYVGQSRHLQLYEAQLVPWIWRLQYRQDCRIFQDKTTPDILKEVLTGAGLSSEGFCFDLIGAYAPRNYCVQYRESDLSFISRLMEDSGIYYYFEHSADKHVLVMADHPGAHRSIPGTPALWFSPPGGMVAEREHVQQFRFGERVRPGKVSMRDFNMHQPGAKMEAADAAKVRPDLEVYSYPGRYQDPGQGAPHHGQSLAKLRLEALQAHRRTGAGSSDCPRITAGHTMSLLGHPRPDLDAEYRILHVSHAGNQPQVLDQDASGEFSYSNEFGVSEKSQPFRAEQTTPRPTMRGLQSATVVGPGGEEVHTDKHGRVKVQFHWDRKDLHDETSSCWVRVSQLWAGNGWGTMFLPRIGHEVLVDFIEGDPDRPVITGRMYHGNNKMPYPDPGDNTKTTIKSDSTIGGGGYNELRFEDKKGQEEVFLHAQKDWNTFILNSMTETVGGSRTSSVGGGETVSVGGARTVNVATSDATTVGAEHTITMAPPPPLILKFPSIPFIPPIPPIVVPMPPVKMTMRSGQFMELTDGLAKITLDAGAITLFAPLGITINGEKVDITGRSGAVTVKGETVDITGRSGAVTVKGETVDITGSSGDVAIKGGPMVKINC